MSSLTSLTLKGALDGLEAGDFTAVELTRAHIEAVESEVVIHHSGHSTQGDPRTVDEVRRILLEHIEKANCGQRPLRVTSPLQPGSTKPGVGAAPR